MADAAVTGCLGDLLYEAWTVIANGAGWHGTTDADRQWRMAAERWRDRWHATLDDARQEVSE